VATQRKLLAALLLAAAVIGLALIHGCRPTNDLDRLDADHDGAGFESLRLLQGHGRLRRRVQDHP
jgi:hypothetical protein